MLEQSETLNASILVVDDKEVNVILLEKMLANAGYQFITSTTSPRMVCPLHSAYHYDLILLDLQMPDMDGFQVMEDLKKIDNDGYLPVVVITAQSEQETRARRAGAADFICKPFDFRDVLARIHHILAGRARTVSGLGAG
jgi:CheY-like chemotaxis protein